MTPNGDGSSIASRIKKPSSRLVHLAGCIYGRGGVGKTTLLGTMPGAGLVIDVPQVEGGTMVLADHAERIKVIEVGKWEELGEVYKYLRDEKHPFKWVAVDTATAVQELAKRKAIRERDLAADPHQMTMQDWGKVGLLNAELYYRFRLLKMHVIFLAQEQLRGTGEEGTLEYQPAVSPASLQALLPAMFLVGRLYVREVEDPETKQTVVERRLRVGPHDRTVTKVRALPGRQLPPVIRNPNLGQIFAYLIGQDIPSPEAVAVEEEGIGIVEIA